MLRVAVFLLSTLARSEYAFAAILAMQAGVYIGFGAPVLKVVASRHVIEALDILF